MLAKTKEAYTAYKHQNIQLKENIKHKRGARKKLEGKATAETTRAEEAAMAAAEEGLPGLEEDIPAGKETKKVKDTKLEVVFKETMEVTEQLRHGLEEKTQELATLQQERSLFRNYGTCWRRPRQW